MKSFDDFVNEGVRDQMTPKTPADIEKIFGKIFKEIEGKDILDKLEILDNKKLLRYLDQRRSMSLVKELLEGADKDNINVTGPNDEFYIFENKNSNGVFIFNKNNFRIYHVGLFAAKEVIGALNYLL